MLILTHANPDSDRPRGPGPLDTSRTNVLFSSFGWHFFRMRSTETRNKQLKRKHLGRAARGFQASLVRDKRCSRGALRSHLDRESGWRVDKKDDCEENSLRRRRKNALLFARACFRLSKHPRPPGRTGPTSGRTAAGPPSRCVAIFYCCVATLCSPVHAPLS